MTTPSDPSAIDPFGTLEPLVPIGLTFPDSNVMPLDRRWIRDPVRRASWQPEDWLLALALRAASLEQSPPAYLALYGRDQAERHGQLRRSAAGAERPRPTETYR